MKTATTQPRLRWMLEWDDHAYARRFDNPYNIEVAGESFLAATTGASLIAVESPPNPLATTPEGKIAVNLPDRVRQVWDRDDWREPAGLLDFLSGTTDPTVSIDGTVVQSSLLRQAIEGGAEVSPVSGYAIAAIQSSTESLPAVLVCGEGWVACVLQYRVSACAAKWTNPDTTP